MKPITKLYLKVFLRVGVLYVLIILGFDLADGNGFRLWKLIFIFFYFGITMSILNISYHIYMLKKNGIQEITNETLKASQTKSLNSEMNKTELIQKLKKDPIIGKMKMTEIENGILIKTKMTWKSFGEEIKIISKSDENSDFEYQVSSCPKLKTTLLDYGKNLENITRIINAIKNIA